MIKKIEIESFSFAGGIVNALLKVQNDRGVSGLSLAMQISKQPELDALVEMIESAIVRAAYTNFGVTESQDKPAMVAPVS